MHVLHINILISECFLVQGSRSCNTEQNGSSLPQNGGRNLPDTALAQEVWAAWERFQSRSQRYLKPSQPPSSLWASPEHPATPMEPRAAPGTSAAGQALCSQLGVLLPDTHSPQGQSHHRNLPARPWTKDTRSSHRTQEQPCSHSVCCSQPPAQH